MGPASKGIRKQRHGRSRDGAWAVQADKSNCKSWTLSEYLQGTVCKKQGVLLWMVVCLTGKKMTVMFLSGPQCCGLALMAECIFFVSDQPTLYPLLEATDNDDIYGAAWIGIFTGFCFFCLSVLGIVGVVKSNRTMLLVVSWLPSGRWWSYDLRNWSSWDVPNFCIRDPPYLKNVQDGNTTICSACGILDD